MRALLLIHSVFYGVWFLALPYAYMTDHNLIFDSIWKLLQVLDARLLLIFCIVLLRCLQHRSHASHFCFGCLLDLLFRVILAWMLRMQRLKKAAFLFEKLVPDLPLVEMFLLSWRVLVGLGEEEGYLCWRAQVWQSCASLLDLTTWAVFFVHWTRHEFIRVQGSVHAGQLVLAEHLLHSLVSAPAVLEACWSCQRQFLQFFLPQAALDALQVCKPSRVVCRVHAR